MTIAPSNFYADFQSLAALKNDSTAQDPKALREAARQFESLFTRMMLKSMREAERAFRSDDSLTESDQTDFYRDMFDNQMALQLSKGKGLGLADMLVKQLTFAKANVTPAHAGVQERSDAKADVAPTQAGIQEKPVANAEANATRDAGREMSNLAPTASPQSARPSERFAPTSPTDFVSQLWPHAAAAARELGVDPRMLIAQAALETGWGKRIPCNADGTTSFNLFGIKAGARWRGAAVGVNTLEFENGVAQRRNESFRAYSSLSECFADYATLIRSSGRYAAALDTGDNAAAFAKALQAGGYATDPNYAEKLTAIAQRLSAHLKTASAPPLAASEPASAGGGET